MKCPRCQHENPPGANFCNACGARLELSCAGCGHTNPAASRFCNRCGQPFDGSQLGRPEPIAPERGSARDPASPAATVRPVGPERSLAAYTPRHLADKILQDLEKQTGTTAKKSEAKGYVAPPDYEYTGRGLVYNCTGKHWACVDGPSYRICEENAAGNKYLKKPVECHPFNVYQNQKGCENMQNRMVSSSAKTNFCNE